MSEHKYILQPYNGANTRYRCPSCQQSKRTFSRYIDAATGEQLHLDVGRCNRENNCGYHYTPKQFFEKNPSVDDSFNYQQPVNESKRNSQLTYSNPRSFIQTKLLRQSLKNYKDNHFIQYLINLLGTEVTKKIISRYFLGTSKRWKGATVFWQIDQQGKIRTGKIMLYDGTTGKRVKKPYNHIYWAHKALKLQNYQLKQCLFGEHLLVDKTKPVALVESEKTAIIASVYLPKFIWLAVGGLSNLDVTKCSALKGRKVVLFPDLNGFDKWNQKAADLSQIANVVVSDLLERKASKEQKKEGLDLADYLVNLDFKGFVVPDKKVDDKAPNPSPIEEFTTNSTQKAVKATSPPNTSWAEEIEELEEFFKYPKEHNSPLRLNAWSIIHDIPLFVETNLSIVRANSDNRAYKPYLSRLKQVKKILSTTQIDIP